MSKLFITENDEVRVNLYVSETNNGSIVAWYDEKDRPSNVGEVEKFTVTFREPTYSDTVQLTDIATRVTEDGEFSVRLSNVRMQRIALLVKEWDFVDSEGNRVVPGIDSVSTLHPNVALALADGLEDALNLFDPEDIESIEKAIDSIKNSTDFEENVENSEEIE